MKHPKPDLLESLHSVIGKKWPPVRDKANIERHGKHIGQEGVSGQSGGSQPGFKHAEEWMDQALAYANQLRHAGKKAYALALIDVFEANARGEFPPTPDVEQFQEIKFKKGGASGQVHGRRVPPYSAFEKIWRDLSGMAPPAKSPIERGGKGSGNFGHAGRPGKVGGSAPTRESVINLPLARKIVNGRKVTENIPNIDSISATFTNWDELQGIREVKLSDFGTGTDKPKFATARQRKAAESLAKTIKNNGWIDPLIIVYDRESTELGPYILEGGTRFDALRLLDAVSFPALVVIDRDPRTGIIQRHGVHVGQEGRPGVAGGSQPGFKHVAGGENWKSSEGRKNTFEIQSGGYKVFIVLQNKKTANGEDIWQIIEQSPDTGGSAELIGEATTAEKAVEMGNRRISQVQFADVEADFEVGEFASVRFGDLAEDMADNPGNFDANTVNSVLAGDTGKIIDQRMGDNGEQQFKIDFDGAEVWVSSDELRFQDDPSEFSPKQFRKDQDAINEVSSRLSNTLQNDYGFGYQIKYDPENLNFMSDRLDQALVVAEEEWREATDERKEIMKGNIAYEYSRLAERVQYLSEKDTEFAEIHGAAIAEIVSNAESMNAPLIAPTITELYKKRGYDFLADTNEGMEEQFSRLYGGIEDDSLRREAIRAHVGGLINEVFQAPLNSPDLEQKAIEMYFDRDNKSPQIERTALEGLLSGEGELSRDSQMAIVTSYARAVNDPGSLEYESMKKLYGNETSEWSALARGLDLMDGQWIPPDAGAGFETDLGRTRDDIQEVAQWMNDAWKETTAKPGSIMMSEIASDIWGGDAIPRERYNASKGDLDDNFDWLDNEETRARATQVVTEIYENTQQQLRDSGIDPNEKVVLYRGMNTATSEWNVGANASGDFNPDDVYGEGDVKMWSLSSWTTDPDVAYGFSGQPNVGAILVAAVPAKSLIANSASGWPCKNEDEWIVSLSGSQKVRIINPTSREIAVEDTRNAVLKLGDPNVRRSKDRKNVLHIDEIDWPWIALWLKKDGQDKDTVDGLIKTPIFEKSKAKKAVNRFMTALERLLDHPTD